MRRFLPLIAVLVMIAIIVPNVVAQEEEPPFTLTIMHTNDEHAAHEPDSNGDGGAAIEATVVDQIRGEVENSLLLDGGDRFTGTLFHIQYQGQDSAQIMNLMGYDAMTLGNHEFDNGDEVLAQFIDALEFPVVTANVDFSQSPTLADKVQPYVILEVGGQQIGIIGLVTPESEILSSPGPELVFEHDLVAVTQGVVDELTAMGINKIILLTHIGYEADLEVAAAVTGVDVVVGGHTNTFLSNAYAGAQGEYPTVLESASGEPVLVVQASTKTKYLGRLDVEFGADGVLASWAGDAILLSRYIPADPEMSDLIAGLAEPIAALREQPIGAEAAAFLDGDRTICRVEECALGNLITDAVRAETGAQIAFENGGGIRADIEAGDITLGEVLTVLPFGNTVATFELTGADVIAALENGVSQIVVTDGLVVRDGAAGRFPQVSGLRFSYDPNLEPGSRIVAVDVLGEDGEYTPIDPAATYFVAANDFMLFGGDGYSVFAENGTNQYPFGRPLDVVVAEYLAANTPISPTIEGRITVVNAEVTPR